MQGSLSLKLAAIDGYTRPAHIVAVPPLQCSRVRYDQAGCPGMACLTLLHLGGVLQGDQLDLDMTLEPGALARLTTAAATQVYRMPECAAAQATTITLHPGARLLYLPEPIILFAGARFSQTTQVVLHEGATLAMRELLVGGRLARGEIHRYECYSARLDVVDPSGRCLLAERALLEPGRSMPDLPGVQDGYPVAGSLYLLTRDGDLTGLLGRAWQALDGWPAVLAGAGILPNDCGVLVRALGTTAQDVRAALDAVLGAVSS